ncbi:MAG: hypothetical protein JWO88_3659 [Frankiales bacterium]|nr:hypothetical protein [Frankiales bacterium]
MRTSVYDPKLGRFLEVDPVEGGSANDYDYVSDDPVNGYDLNGMKQCADAACKTTVVSGPNKLAPAPKPPSSKPKANANQTAASRPATNSPPRPNSPPSSVETPHHAQPRGDLISGAVSAADRGTHAVGNAIASPCGKAVGSTIASGVGMAVSAISTPITTGAGADGFGASVAGYMYGITSMDSDCR